MKNNPFEFLADQVNANLPDSLRPFKEEVKNFSKKMIQDRLSDLDLVTRAEFEAQMDLLNQAEAKIKALEAKITELENQQKEAL